ncbi:MAG: hypothetical protein N2738_06780 [Thermodesulfovibrionales bacterium]|nr:hypothetical protein [Thermodesulfovibrionales bacterium]
MVIRLIAFTTLLIVYFSTTCYAIDLKKGSPEPIIVTSKSLSADNKEKTAIFEGSVVVKRGDVFLYGDKMKIYYGEHGEKGTISKIEADGGIRLVRNKSILTAKSALYLAEPEEVVIFTGEPRATDGNNIITGSKITYFIKDDRSVVEDSRVIINNQGKELKSK